MTRTPIAVREFPERIGSALIPAAPPHPSAPDRRIISHARIE